MTASQESLRDGEGRLIVVMALDVGDGRIQSVSSIVNPGKLRHLDQVADRGRS